MDIMVALADDKVVNVKLVLAEIVKNHFDSKGKLSNDETFLKLKAKLQADPNEEVRSVFDQEVKNVDLL
jgi:hypothetical protein